MCYASVVRRDESQRDGRRRFLDVDWCCDLRGGRSGLRGRLALAAVSAAVMEGVSEMGKRCVVTTVIVPEQVQGLFEKADAGDREAFIRLRAIEHWIGLRDRQELYCVTCKGSFSELGPRGFVLIIPQYEAAPEVMCAGVCAGCFGEYERDWRSYCLRVTRMVAADAEILVSEIGRA